MLFEAEIIDSEFYVSRRAYIYIYIPHLIHLLQ